MNIIGEIFKGRELTIDRDGAYLNKWNIKEQTVEIPLSVANYLRNNKIITLDSGNFDTGEKHYVYDRNTKYDLPESI